MLPCTTAPTFHNCRSATAVNMDPVPLQTAIASGKQVTSIAYGMSACMCCPQHGHMCWLNLYVNVHVCCPHMCWLKMYIDVRTCWPQALHACRQPFVLTLSIAAIAADTGSNVSVQDCAQIGKYGPHHHRSRAKQQVDIHINKLLQSSTLWSLATKHADAMAGYVYLRRALDGRARIGQVTTYRSN